jgi:hypothetical protein
MLLVQFVGIALASAIGCDRVGAHHTTVEFSSSGGIEGSLSVYLAGVRIGITGVVAGVAGARVPLALSLRHRDAVPSCSIFLIANDLIANDPKEPDQRCLIGYAFPDLYEEETGLARGDRVLFQGAANRLELAVVVEAAKARLMWKSLAE